MKIGLVIDDHMGRAGGVQEYVRGLYHYLRGHGHTPVILAGGSNSEQREHIIELGRSISFHGSGSSTSVPLTLETSRSLRHLLEREQFDILHVMAPYSPTLSGRLLVHSDAAHVMTMLVALEPPWWRAVLGAVAHLQRRSARTFDARIAISRVAEVTGCTLYGGSYDIIPCGIRVGPFEQARQQAASAPPHDLRLVYVGRLEERKGVIYLIDAFALLERQYPRLQLVIVGDGPERTKLISRVQELGLRQVEFRGYVPAIDLPMVMASADLLCAPATHAESFGIVLIEAMAAGLPIVAAGNAGYAALLADHPGNLVVPPADPRRLAGAIATYIASKGLREMVAKRNGAGAHQYDWERIGARVIKVYERAVAQRRRRL